MRKPWSFEIGTFNPIYNIPELMNKVVEYVDPQSLVACVQLANKTLHGMCNDRALWKIHCIQSNYVVTKDPSNQQEEECAASIDFKQTYLNKEFEKVQDKYWIKNYGSKFYGLEYSKSNRASCAQCKKKISKDVLRVLETVPEGFSYYGYEKTVYLHWACFKRRCPDGITIERINHWKELEEEDQERVKMFFDQKADDKRQKYYNKLDEGQYIHTCNNCEELICGKIFRCYDCGDDYYELCETCKNNNDDDDEEGHEHKLTRQKFGQVLQCELCESEINKSVFICRACEQFSVCNECHENEILAGTNKHSCEHTFFQVGKQEKQKGRNSRKRSREEQEEEDSEEEATTTTPVISRRNMVKRRRRRGPVVVEK